MTGRRLSVQLHGEDVGEITEQSSGRVSFRLLPEYRERTPRPVLGQKFEDDLERTYTGRRVGALPDFFANLIPEEGPLRRILLKAMRTEDADDLDLLAFVGHDLPGAVVVQADRSNDVIPDWSPPPPMAGERPDDFAAPEDLIRFSLAGVQLKFSMLREGELLTFPATGRGGRWIVKFPSPSLPRLPENEHAMLSWARAAGFDVAEFYLHSKEQLSGLPRRFLYGEEPVLAVRRFDRDGDRIHQEDFAQAVGLPPEQKYEHLSYEVIGRLIRRFVDDSAVDELVKRLIFVIASGNNDAHLKNWSIIYPDRIQAQWSPLYDQVSTVAWPQPDRDLALKLAGVKPFRMVDRAAVRRFANRIGIAEEHTEDLAAETLLQLGSAFAEATQVMPTSHREALKHYWDRVPLLREFGFQPSSD